MRWLGLRPAPPGGGAGAAHRRRPQAAALSLAAAVIVVGLVAPGFRAGAGQPRSVAAGGSSDPAAGGCRALVGSAPLPPCPVVEVEVALGRVPDGAGRGESSPGFAPVLEGEEAGGAGFRPLEVDLKASRLVAPPGWRAPAGLKAVVLYRQGVLGLGSGPLARPVAGVPSPLSGAPAPWPGLPTLRLIRADPEGDVVFACGRERFGLAPGASWARAWARPPGGAGPTRRIDPGPAWGREIAAALGAGYDLVRVEVRNLGPMRVEAAGTEGGAAGPAPAGRAGRSFPGRPAVDDLAGRQGGEPPC
ncbi:MAG: hypothetical protein K6T75_08310 [Acetobacteraceae bacterium]|nr:hypothetical protein [Acetobacteraceae bacterium]